MADDPLARFRRKQESGAPAPYEATIASPEGSQPQQASDEHRALRAAIDALNEIPNTPLSGAYKNTYALIPVLETVYQNAEQQLQQRHAGMTDAEIDAAVAHDLGIIEANQQPDFTRMTDEEIEKAAQAVQLLEKAVKEAVEERQRQREDIEPEP